MTRGLSFASPLPASDFCAVFGFEVSAGEVDFLKVSFGAGSDSGIVAGAGAAGMRAPGTTGGTMRMSFMACARSIAVSGVVLST